MKKSMPILSGSGRFAVLGSILVLGAVFLLGCGGSDAPAPAPDSAPAPAAPADAAGPPAAAPSDPTPESEAAKQAPVPPAEGPSPEKTEPAVPEGTPPPATKTTPEEEAAKAPEETAPAPPATESAQQAKPRPDDVVVWTDDDYRSAKEDRDPKLLDAVAYLGENKSGDAKAASLLAELLVMPEDPEPEPKPEPKVEKKPEPKPSGYDSYMGPAGYMPPMEDTSSGMEDMSGMAGYMGAQEDMYGEYSGPGGRKTEVKMPLAASYVSLTGGIVRALGANGTKEARAVFEQLLMGKLPAGNERAAVGAVLRTLVDYSSAENDALLQKALTVPENYRPSREKLTAAFKLALGATAAAPKEAEKPKEAEESSEGERPKAAEKAPDIDALVAAALANKVTAEDIRDTTLPLIEKSASMRLRYDLAVYLVGQPSESLGPRLQELVTVTNPLNVQAQIGLYRYPKTPPEMRDSFERYFTSYASCTLGRMLAVSTDEGVSIEEPMAAAGPGGLSQGEQKAWSGFGDKTTKRPETPAGSSGAYGPPLSGSGGAYGGGPPPTEGLTGEEGYMPPESSSSPGPPPGASQMYGEQAMPSAEGMMGSGGEGGAAKPLAGPGKVDQASVKEFQNVAAANPNLPYELAQQLWSNELGNTLAAKMNALPTLADGAQLVMLAGHIPTDAMRAQLLKTLQTHWTEGPGAFASANVTNEIGISDPGFIAIIKSLPRREPPAKAAKVEPNKEQDAQYAWMQAVYGTVRGFCEQFQKAADNQMANKAELIAKLPFPVHSADAVTHVYAMDWQESVGSRLGGGLVSPMRIYYLRCEDTGLYNKVEGTYKRAVPSGTERLVMNGLWIDGSKPGPQPGRRTTMDVIIDRTDYKRERKVGEAEPMVVQVLYVEINDPNPPKAPEAAAAG